MTTQEKIREDIKTAMKERSQPRLDILRGLQSALKNRTIDLQKDLDEPEVVAVIKGELKKLKDALDSFESGGREDLAEKTRQEIEILQIYLPEEMSDEELDASVRAKLSDLAITEPKDIGRAMGAVMSDLKDKVDGARVRQKIEEILKK